jgi:hypothetical protein
VTCAEFQAAYDPGFDTRFGSAALDAAIDHVTDCAACSNWYMRTEVEAAGADPDAHPCVHMAYHSLHQCLEHSDARDCPETLIVQWQGRYALPVRNGGRGTIAIAFCPWCGVPLPRR